MVIAALAVAFAIMPMPVAIVLALCTTCLVALGRNQWPMPDWLSQSKGCLMWFFVLLGGLFGAEVFGSLVRRPVGVRGRVGDGNLWIAGVMLGAFGGLMVEVFGRFLAAAISRQRDSTAEEFDWKRDKTRAQLKLVEHLLRRAHEDGDEDVTSKLSEYRSRLEHDLQL